jgi:hypothetical protein
MLSDWSCASRIAQVITLMLCGTAAHAQTGSAWVDPPTASPAEQAPPVRMDAPADAAASVEGAIEPPAMDLGAREPVATSSVGPGQPSDHHLDRPGLHQSAQKRERSASRRDSLAHKKLAARDLAFSYLDRWSAPNPVTLASASSFYGPSVKFHGQTRHLDSVLAEKRRFAERWPDRSYRYRPETTQVACDSDGARCTVWSIFDWSANNSRAGRHSRGIGAHELVVSFTGDSPVIASEDSRVLGRGGTQRR